MSVTNITGTEIGPIVVNSAGDTYNIKKGATLVIGGSSGGGEPIAAIIENIENPAANHNNTYNIDGRVFGYQAGMYTVGANDKILIGDTGEVTGSYGVVAAGKNSLVVNDGEILGNAEGYGIYGYHTSGTEIRNNGLVSGNAGIYYDGDKGLIVNGADGLIAAGMVGIYVAHSTAMPAVGTQGESEAAIGVKAQAPETKVINHGTVLATTDGGAAFAVSDAVNINLINDGTLKGIVALGDGDSTFDNRGGVVKGSIVGGLGDDMLIVDNAKYKLFEDVSGGDDTVKSTVTYTLSANVEKLVLLGTADIDGTGTGGDETLRGNTGNNTLKGLAGADDLFGGKGNDRLFGGGDTDTFHFSTGDGNDKVMDFHAMETDKIDVSDWTGIGNISQVKSHAHDQGADVVIENGSDSLLIVGLHKADLVAGYFDFTA